MSLATPSSVHVHTPVRPFTLRRAGHREQGGSAQLLMRWVSKTWAEKSVAGTRRQRHYRLCTFTLRFDRSHSGHAGAPACNARAGAGVRTQLAALPPSEQHIARADTKRAVWVAHARDRAPAGGMSSRCMPAVKGGALTTAPVAACAVPAAQHGAQRRPECVCDGYSVGRRRERPSQRKMLRRTKGLALRPVPITRGPDVAPTRGLLAVQRRERKRFRGSAACPSSVHVHTPV